MVDVGHQEPHQYREEGRLPDAAHEQRHRGLRARQVDHRLRPEKAKYRSRRPQRLHRDERDTPNASDECNPVVFVSALTLKDGIHDLGLLYTRNHNLTYLSLLLLMSARVRWCSRNLSVQQLYNYSGL